jgi:hypothetical protein
VFYNNGPCKLGINEFFDNLNITSLYKHSGLVCLRHRQCSPHVYVYKYLACPGSTRIGHEYLPVTNALAYHAGESKKIIMNFSFKMFTFEAAATARAKPLVRPTTFPRNQRLWRNYFLRDSITGSCKTCTSTSHWERTRL